MRMDEMDFHVPWNVCCCVFQCGKNSNKVEYNPPGRGAMCSVCMQMQSLIKC